MKARFRVGVVGDDITSLTPDILQKPLHPNLIEKLSESPPGIYEVDVMTVQGGNYPKGVVVQKQGAKIVPVKTQ